MMQHKENKGAGSQNEARCETRTKIPITKSYSFFQDQWEERHPVVKSFAALIRGKLFSIWRAGSPGLDGKISLESF